MLFIRNQGIEEGFSSRWIIHNNYCFDQLNKTFSWRMEDLLYSLFDYGA